MGALPRLVQAMQYSYSYSYHHYHHHHSHYCHYHYAVARSTYGPHGLRNTAAAQHKGYPLTQHTAAARGVREVRQG